jgi:N-acetylglucosaminyldiphosphoundecaprenol N-acetyl-beta-D-mannosaminyltransferase
MAKNVSVMSFEVFSGELEKIVLSDTLKIINTINAFSYVQTKRNKTFVSALKKADILLPDGFPIVLASRLLKGKCITKIAGEDLFYFFMNKMNIENGRVFFLGASQETLNLIIRKANKEFPNITIGVYSPPYKSEFSDEDSNLMIERVNEFNSDVVFVGMTAPKQEIWMHEHKEQIQAKAMCAVGAVFDFYAGTVKRAPEWMIKFKLEWFYRLVKEPKRMWKRYLVYSPLFFWDLFLYWIRVKK